MLAANKEAIEARVPRGYVADRQIDELDFTNECSACKTPFSMLETLSGNRSLQRRREVQLIRKWHALFAWDE
jgi:hypothetical protein